MVKAGDAPSAASRLVIDVPAWVDEVIGSARADRGDEDKMALVLRLARENVARGTGGPFGAAIFEIGSGRIVAVGFDEGPVFAESYAYLAERGITTVRDVKRAEAASIIRAYRDAGGPIYNARGV